MLGMLALVLVACDSPRQRPFGTLKLGALTSLTEAEQFFPEIGILLRRDKDGFSAMSTHCTFDLIPLRLEGEGANKTWVSPSSASRYAYDGTVLSGPARSPLPYFSLFLTPWVAGDEPDTLFVKVGIPVLKDWRFAIPISK